MARINPMSTRHAGVDYDLIEGALCLAEILALTNNDDTVDVSGASLRLIPSKRDTYACEMTDANELDWLFAPKTLYDLATSIGNALTSCGQRALCA